MQNTLELTGGTRGAFDPADARRAFESVMRLAQNARRRGDIMFAKRMLALTRMITQDCQILP